MLGFGYSLVARLMNTYFPTFSHPALPGAGTKTSTSRSSSVPPASHKRPPASPALGRGAVPEIPVAGQTPVKSPETKKTKVDTSEPTQVEQTDEDLVADAASSPVGPDMNLTEEFLQREQPEPKCLDKAFEATQVQEDMDTNADDQTASRLSYLLYYLVIIFPSCFSIWLD